MGHMKKYKCPICLSTSFVVKYGYRNKAHRFFCKKCKKHFSFNPCSFNKRLILNDHLDGLSFRKIAIKYNISASKAYRICSKKLKELPDNNQFTHKYCNRFSHILMCDGKYILIKGFKYKIPLLWGIDYFRHDIPFFVLSSSENYHSWAKYFMFFRLISHRPQLVVCDDNVNIKMAARRVFPSTNIQTCTNHFKEGLRRDLRTRSDNRYIEFMKRIESIFSYKLAPHTFNYYLWCLYRDFNKDPVCLSVLTNIEKHKQELVSYRGIRRSPTTTNLMECLNSHLQSRLGSIKGFESYTYTRLWINGYILKRRYTKYTGCTGKFRALNGKMGLQMTKKHGLDLPTLF